MAVVEVVVLVVVVVVTQSVGLLQLVLSTVERVFASDMCATSSKPLPQMCEVAVLNDLCSSLASAGFTDKVWCLVNMYLLNRNIL